MTPKLSSYDVFLATFSGGKDSLACLLHLLDLGVPRNKIELWHQDIDGQEGSTLMDWPCTRDYVRKVGEAFKVPVYYSWREGGFEREMLREGQPTARVIWEEPGGKRGTTGGKGSPGTRLRFPQLSADLSTRWCSAYLKIDVAASALRNQARFENTRTLYISGERGEESANRARYKELEPHRSDLRDGRVPRYVDHWRPVLHWPESYVWEIISRYSVNPHPAYRLGWGRVSCSACIFGSASQFASLRAIHPKQFNYIAKLEKRFGVTIKRKHSLPVLADKGTPYPMEPHDIKAALSHTFNEPVILPQWAWRLPRGAFGESCGPT